MLRIFGSAFLSVSPGQALPAAMALKLQEHAGEGEKGVRHHSLLWLLSHLLLKGVCSKHSDIKGT